MNRGRSGQGGVILLESLIAVLIFSIGLLAVIGLQANAVTSVSDAKYRLDASAAANRLIGQMWGNVANLATYAGQTYTVPEIPSGQMTTSALNGSTVTITVTWQPPGAATAHNFVTVASVYGG